MPQVVCDYCGGSGRDAITPTRASCWKCSGMGVYWVQPKTETSIPAPGRPAPARKYALLPFMQALLDSVPRWLNVALAIAGLVAGAALGRAIDPSMGGGFWLVSIGGLALGAVILPLVITMTDMCLRLALVLLKVAVVVAIAGAVIYGLLRLSGS